MKATNPDAESTASRRKPRVVLLVLLITIILVASGSWYARVWRPYCDRQQTRLDFVQVGVALHTYCASWNTLPPGAPITDEDLSSSTSDVDEFKHLLSWRYSILSQLEPKLPFPNNYDRSWDSSHHVVARSFPTCFVENGSRSSLKNQKAIESHQTRIFAIAGPGTAFGDGDKFPPRALSELDDDTILIVEIENSDCHWMQPGDFDVRNIPRKVDDASCRCISSSHRQGVHVGFADGSVWYLRNDVPFESLEKFFTVDSAKKHDRNEWLFPYLVTNKFAT